MSSITKHYELVRHHELIREFYEANLLKLISEQAVVWLNLMSH
ncbi:hypothetical protein [Tengunoibacter tsumagoiensis]|nr:hypothetical protein [Tengunoibacter tsumagoiensis]